MLMCEHNASEAIPFILHASLPKTQSACPTALGLRNKHLIVRLQGLEPWTNRLRVYCSTN